MKDYKYDPESEFDSVINLSALLQEAKNGEFENLHELKKEFKEIIRCVHHSKRLSIQAFLDQSVCECAEFTKPEWSLRKHLVGYYYHFEKTCKCCGRLHSTDINDWSKVTDPYPEGYEGAVNVYYNLNI